MKHLHLSSVSLCAILLISLFLFSCSGEQSSFVQGLSVVASYGYNLSGRTDRVQGFLFKIDDVNKMSNPCLVFLAKGVDNSDEAIVEVNRNKYKIPSIVDQSNLKTELPSDREMGKRGFYALSQRDDLLGKIIIPLNPEHLRTGINEATFLKGSKSDGYEIPDTRIESTDAHSAEVAGVTYRIIARGRPASVSDFDFIMNYKGEDKRKESDVPDWARRGKVRFYRAGNDFEHLDRMFEMYKEAHINLITTHIPPDKNSKEYARVKKFVDRCHENGIQVTAFFSLGGIRLSEVMMNPELKQWVSRDEYGDLRWREHGRTYLADLTNEGYLRERLRNVETAIDAGVDEIYYDYAIGGTGEVVEFMAKIRSIIKKKGKNLTIYGNCKGDILADDLCDLTKSEGTEEAGVFDGEWVHNVTQSRFYYAAGDGWKSYRSKYEGADPGVANPGAHDIREGMKYGWKRPIAEASAFQSHFAIAESGTKLRNGWIHKDNALAMEIWEGICRYNKFIDENEDCYTDVRTVTKVGVVAPPVIPSFEVALTRIPLFDAMAELNIMYDILLLSRLSTDLLEKYKAIVIPDIPYVTAEQLNLIKEYKKNGGKIYTLGSTNELREIADIYSPSSLIQAMQRGSKRDVFKANMCKLSGEPLVTVENGKYVIANVVRKVGTEKIILHLVNYSEPLKNVYVKVNLNGFTKGIDKKSIVHLTPDSVPLKLEGLSVKGNVLEFTIPELEIYNVVTIN